MKPDIIILIIIIAIIIDDIFHPRIDISVDGNVILSYHWNTEEYYIILFNIHN